MRLTILLATLLLAGTSLAGERALTDDGGRKVTIPEKLERIVVMHEALLGLPLMDLGISPVGSYGRGDDGRSLTAVDFIDTVLGQGHDKPKGIGAVGQIDLEKLRALNPDLIIGTERDLDKLAQLEPLGPVYIQNVSTGKARGFSVEAELADVVGAQDALATRRQTYLNHLEKVRQKMPPKQGATYLALIVHDQINLVGDMSGAVQAIEDLGFARLPMEGLVPGAGMGSTFSLPINAESFGRLDPDLLVIMNSYAGKDRSEAAIRARLDKLLPGWDRFLKPVREGRVLFLDSGEVATPTIASAEHTLDAFEAVADR
ncbi:ABC transporter substrate-binding protein [Rhizobium sp. AAP43]|uniref:ABC transporter substrate-binding protein n=1 Tax=Rhizobium sp. AAP43 TaxID=1523420 RepID=UPI0006B8D208|nr:ABC transporter substrate-binding protein [Rhizobium sp. AAP43]KPF46038.1 ABC transporter substrate-binding protein [Rhizobium sp. AAP43]